MRYYPDTAVIFCAGRGTRMKHLSADQPKPMIKVAGQPLVDHAISQIVETNRIFANLHYCPDVLGKYLSFAGLETELEPDLLETGGGLKNLLPRIDQKSVYTINSDCVWKGPKATSILRSAWNSDIMDALLLTVPIERSHGHLGKGDFTLHHDGRMTRGGSQIFTGAQIIKSDPVAAIDDREFSLNVVWQKILSENRLYGIEYPGEWGDVGYPEAIPIAETLLGG